MTNETLLGKEFPNDNESERNLLSAVIFEEENIHKIKDFLLIDDFYKQIHQQIYEAMLILAENKHTINIVTLANQLKPKKIEHLNAYLIELKDLFPTSIDSYVKIIKDKAIRRNLINRSITIIQDAFDEKDDPFFILDKAEKNILEISKLKSGKKTWFKLEKVLTETINYMAQNRGMGEDKINGISSGFKKIDRMTCGFQKGEMIVLGARPSMGKTALALNMAINIGKSGLKVGFISLEMTKRALGIRILSGETNIDAKQVKTADLDEREWHIISNAIGNLREHNIFFDDDALNIMELRYRVRRLKQEEGLDVLFIDYLGLISSYRKNIENRTAEVAELSKSVKLLAKELNIPIILLSQLSRNLEARQDKRPINSDLRDSGSIEQDADVIMFLYRDVKYNPDAENPDEVEIIIRKNRNGETGTVYLSFKDHLTKFEEYND